MIRVQRIRANQGTVLKMVRCRALKEAPYAFSSTIEGALQRSDESWATQARECALSPKKLMVLAYADDEDTPCGLMGCQLEGDNGERAELFSVWVEPEVRHLGVAGHMLEFVQ